MILGLLGALLLIMGIVNIVVATKYSDWEAKEYTRITNKTPSKNIKNTTTVVGWILVILGGILLAMYVHEEFMPSVGSKKSRSKMSFQSCPSKRCY